MGIQFVAFSQDGQIWFCESVKWLRDYAPHELFYDNLNAMKEVMSVDDICEYWKDITGYLEKLEYRAAIPGETDTYNEWYDKWVSPDKEYYLDDWLYEKLKKFTEVLYKCVELRLSARWSI